MSKPYSEGIAARHRHPEEDDVDTNRVRVILGGLLAGLVINIVEYITNGVVLKQAWGQAMQTLGKSAELSAGAIVMFNVWGFLLGIAAVWLYAAMRPRYGPGASTAIRAGFAALGACCVSSQPQQLPSRETLNKFSPFHSE